MSQPFHRQARQWVMLGAQRNLFYGTGRALECWQSASHPMKTEYQAHGSFCATLDVVSGSEAQRSFEDSFGERMPEPNCFDHVGLRELVPNQPSFLGPPRSLASAKGSGLTEPRAPGRSSADLFIPSGTVEVGRSEGFSGPQHGGRTVGGIARRSGTRSACHCVRKGALGSGAVGGTLARNSPW